MATVNLGVRFLLELGGVVAVGYAGLHAAGEPVTGALLGGAAAGALILAWSAVVAPAASNRLAQPQRDLIGTGLLLAAAVALAGADRSGVALVFAVAVAANQVLLRTLGPAARAAWAPRVAHPRAGR